MNYFPIFVQAEGLKIVVAGAGSFAEAKIRLILKTPAALEVVAASEPTAAISAWAEEGRLVLTRRSIRQEDVSGAGLVYAAHMDDVLDDQVVAWAHEAGVWVNAVDRQDASDFITPAVVDRAPVVVAIGTEGAGPVLARWVKAKIEALLPSNVGALARLARRHRPMAKQVPVGKPRRSFWQALFQSLLASPALLDESEKALDDHVARVLDQCLNRGVPAGRVDFIGAGPGDADLITVKGSRILHDADVVIHDRLVGEAVLDLARREALMIDVGKKGFGAATSQDEINSLIVAHALKGQHVVRLKGGDPSIFGRLDEEIAACKAADIHWQVVPGITTASAASASLGCSLSRRERNQEITFLTGHSMKGYAEHDWQRLAEPGRVIAIYMGRRSAQFLQSRMMMFGADPQTPVQCLTDVSLPTETHLSARLDNFAQRLQAAVSDQPLLILYGVEDSSTGQLMRSLDAIRSPVEKEVRHGVA